MPIYRYRCEACDHTFSTLVFDHEGEQLACEACGSERLERLPGVPGVVFKGKGFYVTDRRSSPAKANGSSAGSNGSSSASASSSEKTT